MQIVDGELTSWCEQIHKKESSIQAGTTKSSGTKNPAGTDQLYERMVVANSSASQTIQAIVNPALCKKPSNASPDMVRMSCLACILAL